MRLCHAGPVNIHENVLRAMDRPSQNHRDPWFPPFFQSILEDTKMIFKTKEGTPFIFPGTGTGGWECALTNTLSPGDKVVTFRYGQFSHLWVDMMQRLGLDVSGPIHAHGVQAFVLYSAVALMCQPEEGHVTHDFVVAYPSCEHLSLKIQCL